MVGGHTNRIHFDVHPIFFESPGEGGSELGAAERFPSSNGVWKLKTNETEDFGGIPFVLKQSSFTAENAPESP